MMENRKVLLYTGLSIVLIACLVVEMQAAITYGCFPNGTISVENPNNTHFSYAVASDFELIGTELADPSALLCEVCFNENKSRIIISENAIGNCHRGNYIQLTLSSKPLSEEIIVQTQQETENYRLRCIEVPEEGVTVTVVQEFDPILALFDLPPDELEPGVMPNFSGSVQSAMRRCCDYRTHPPIKSANVGDHLHWTLDVFHEFYLFPVQCDAYSGLTTTGEPRMTLYNHGCSMDPSLTHYNTTDTFDNIRMYVMDFYVFHFYNSKYITIQCSIRICGPDNKETCEWNENCERRKRSAIEVPGNMSGNMVTKTQMTLQVLGYPNAARKTVASWWILRVALFLAAFLLKCCPGVGEI